MVDTPQCRILHHIFYSASRRVDLFNEGRGQRILYSFELSNDDRQKYNTVSNKSEAHFVKRRNPIYKQTSLICMRRQKEGEPVDLFITLLALLASRTLQLSYTMK